MTNFNHKLKGTNPKQTQLKTQLETKTKHKTQTVYTLRPTKNFSPSILTDKTTTNNPHPREVVVTKNRLNNNTHTNRPMANRLGCAEKIYTHLRIGSIQFLSAG